jgi:hypothetical protein
LIEMELSRDEFRLWLATHDPEAKPFTKTHCPLNVWTGYEIGPYYFDTMGDTCLLLPLPKWAKQFVKHIDEIASVDRACADWSSLSVKDALEVLDELDFA